MSETCATCRWWDSDDRVGVRRMAAQPGRGEPVHACRLTESEDDQPANPDAWRTDALAGIRNTAYADGGAVLWTSAAYGCNQWENQD